LRKIGFQKKILATHDNPVLFAKLRDDVIKLAADSGTPLGVSGVPSLCATPRNEQSMPLFDATVLTRKHFAVTMLNSMNLVEDLEFDESEIDYQGQMVKSGGSWWHCYTTKGLPSLHAPTKDMLGLYHMMHKLCNNKSYLPMVPKIRIRAHGELYAFSCDWGLGNIDVEENIMSTRMWPMQGVGKQFFENICSLVTIGNVNELYFPKAYDPQSWGCDNRYMAMPYYLPIHGLCENVSALDSHSPIFRTPTGTFRRAGMAQFYPLIMFMAMIAIGNEDDGITYADIFKHDAITKEAQISTNTFGPALQRLNLKSPAKKYLDMINNQKAALIRSPDELRTV